MTRVLLWLGWWALAWALIVLTWVIPAIVEHLWQIHVMRYL